MKIADFYNINNNRLKTPNFNTNYTFKGLGFLKFLNNLSPLKKDTVELTPPQEKEKELCGEIRELKDEEFETLKEQLSKRIEKFNQNKNEHKKQILKK